MREHDGAGEAKHHQAEILGSVEFQREPGHRRARRRDHHRRDRTGDKRGNRCDRQRRSGAALLRHLMAVQAGHDRRRFARDVDQDGGGRAAVLRAVENTGQHDQRRGRRQRERERQQDRDGGDRCNAGQHADKRADQRAEKAEAEVGRRKRDCEAQWRDWQSGPLRRSTHCGHTGIGNPSTVTNRSTAKIASATAKSAFSRSRDVVSGEPRTDHHREACQRQTNDRQEHREQRDRYRDQ